MRARTATRVLRALFLAVLAAIPLAATPTAGADPWSTSAVALRTLFTGPIVQALAAVAVVISGLMYAFSTHQDKGKIAALVFGLAMALSSGTFLNWITGGTVAATIDAGVPAESRLECAASGSERAPESAIEEESAMPEACPEGDAGR